MEHVGPNARKFYLNIVGIMTDPQNPDWCIMAFRYIMTCLGFCVEIIVFKPNKNDQYIFKLISSSLFLPHIKES